MKDKVLSAIHSIIEEGKEKGLLGELDDIVAKNSLFNIFQIEDNEGEGYKKYDGMEALEVLYQYDDLDLPFEKFVSRIMGEITPRNSEIIDKFYYYLKRGESQKAIDWYYKLCQDTRYIRMDRVNMNRKWKYSSKYGDIEITINLSKPEKDPRNIGKARNGQSNTYPKCVLCKENIGYKGRPGHPERSNHRIIPIKLNNEKWYLQFSPYVYYNQHLIVLSHDHVPMLIDHRTIIRLLDFIDMFPDLFLGSNAGLPIVGGSILDHNHFQGGNHVFPIERANIFERIDKGKYQIDILDWPVSTIRITSKDREVLTKKAAKIMDAWDYYENRELEILPFTKEEKHNTTTLIARKEEDKYHLYISLRNNRCNEEYPYGIFHAREEHHHIKKENIGLIEVMGLAILPGRLHRELEYIKNILLYNKDMEEEGPHKNWVYQLKEEYQGKISSQNIDSIIKEEVGKVFVNILEDCGVFKRADYDKFKEFVYSCIE